MNTMTHVIGKRIIRVIITVCYSHSDSCYTYHCSNKGYNSRIRVAMIKKGKEIASNVTIQVRRIYHE